MTHTGEGDRFEPGDVGVHRQPGGGDGGTLWCAQRAEQPSAQEFGVLRTELKSDNADLRTELKGDLARLDDRVAGLDDRVYALAVGLRPRLREDNPIEPGGSTA